MGSKFSFKSFFPILSIPFLIFGLTTYIYIAVYKAKTPPPLHGVPLMLLLVFTLMWLFFGEFRTKMIKLRLEDTYLVIKRYGGLSSASIFTYNDLQGFKTSMLNSNGGNYEYLYFIQNGKKVGKISQFYHKNYQELKDEIENKLPDLGFEKFSYIQELKESFT